MFILKRMYPFILGFIIIILNLIDAQYTKYVVESGVCEEVNPFMKYLMDNYSMDTAINVKMITIIIVVTHLMTVFESKLARLSMWIIIVFYTLLCSWHLYTFITLTNMGLL